MTHILVVMAVVAIAIGFWWAIEACRDQP